MSMRTIVEFNHDEGVKIEADPEGFLRAIINMIKSGVCDADDSHEQHKRENLERYGVTVTPTHHHSTKAEVVLSHEHGGEFYRKQF